jgi:hypothetical protein
MTVLERERGGRVPGARAGVHVAACAVVLAAAAVLVVQLLELPALLDVGEFLTAGFAKALVLF